MAATESHPDRGAGRGLSRWLRATAAALAKRVVALPVPAVVATLALVQWAALIAVAMRVGHDGWIYDAGHRPGSGVVSALPAIVIVQVLFVLPLVLWMVLALAEHLAGRLFAVWASVVWVVLPFAGLAFATPSFRHTYADGFLTHVLGLTADPAFAAMVALLAAGLFAVRAARTGAALDLVATIAFAATAAAFLPQIALVAAAAPVAALAAGGNRRQAAAAAGALALLLIGVGLAVSAGLLTSPFAQIGFGAPSAAAGTLRENFWSGRVLEWLVIAGIIGALRRYGSAAAFVCVAAVLAFLSIDGGSTLEAQHLAMLQGTLPAWPAIVIAIASVTLLVPRGHAAQPAGAALTSLWLRLQQPGSLRRPGAAPAGAAAPAAPVDASATIARPVATPLWAVIALSGFFVVIAFVGVWNAARYPIMLGYDAQEHITYADQLINHGKIPSQAQGGEYYTPPGYYALAGAATWVGRQVGMAEPHQAAQYMNVLFVLATAALLLVLARLLFPRRPVVWVAALGFFAFLPVVSKTAAMFHPETLNMLLSTAALTTATWMLLRRRFDLRWFLVLGLFLGAGQLVRASSLFTFVSIAIGFAAALTSGRFRQRMPLRKIAYAVVAILLITTPWYARQAIKYHTQPFYSQPGFVHQLLHPTPAAPGARSHFLGVATNDILHDPVRPFYVNQALSETYTEIWGDWTGNFAWSGYSAGPWLKALNVLQDQSEIGVLPTLLAIAGWLGLVVLLVRRRVERIPFLPLTLLPLLATLAYLYRGYISLTPDGDLFKASYLLTTAPVWAIAFGLAFSWLTRWRMLALGLAVAFLILGVLELRFMLYGIRDHNVIF